MFISNQPLVQYIYEGKGKDIVKESEKGKLEANNGPCYTTVGENLLTFLAIHTLRLTGNCMRFFIQKIS